MAIERSSPVWSLARLIDQTCDQFEAALQRGAQPLIEEFTSPHVSDDHIFSQLLQELVAIELIYRRRNGETTVVEDYLGRFASHPLVIQQAFHEVCGPNLDTVRAAAADTLELSSASSLRPAPRVGGRIGDYQLLDQLGQGGMGVVFKARQLHADRVVALKLIRPDLLASSSLAERATAIERFRNEARAAAQLDHDNIVTVYDVNTSDDLLYYTMRYVQGLNLAEMLHDGPLSSRCAAEYLLPVAQAVADAHDHQILHRDIKPNNILIADDGRPYVMDFGMAKSLQADQALTQDGAGLGTPGFMAPEQAQSAATADGACDVYGLGATLYAMLTARPPFQGPDPIATLRQVVDDDPVPPRQLNGEVAADLQTICLKCLEKDPRRRYATASNLAEDLGRFRRGEPIRARPSSFRERTWRWCRRNPVPSALAATLVAVVLIGFGLVTWQWQRAVVHAAAAQRNFDHALSTVDEYFTTVSEDVLLQEPGMQPLREKLLKSALTYYQTFIDEHRGDSQLRVELAEALHRVGRITLLLGSNAESATFHGQAITVLREVLRDDPSNPDVRRQLAKSITNQGLLRKRSGDAVGAIGDCQEAIEIFEALVEHDPANAEDMHALARVLNNQGSLYGRLDRQAEAVAAYQRSIELQSNLLLQGTVDVRDSLAMCHANLGRLWKRRGEYARAKQSFAEAFELRKQLSVEFPERDTCQYLLARSFINLSAVHRAEDTQGARLKCIHQALDIAERLSFTNPTVMEYQELLAMCFGFLAEALSDDQQLHDARATRIKSNEIWEQVVSKNPQDAEALDYLARGYGKLAAVSADPHERLDAYQQSVNIKERLVTMAPDLSASWALGKGYDNLRGVFTELEDYRAALDYSDRALDFQRDLVARQADVLRHTVDLGLLLHHRAHTLQAAKDLTSAADYFRRGRDVFAECLAHEPDDVTVAKKLAALETDYEDLLRSIGPQNDATAGHPNGANGAVDQRE